MGRLLLLEGNHGRRAAELPVEIVGLAARDRGSPDAADVFLVGDHLFEAAGRRHLRSAAAHVAALLPRQHHLGLLRLRAQLLYSAATKEVTMSSPCVQSASLEKNHRTRRIKTLNYDRRDDFIKRRGRPAERVPRSDEASRLRKSRLEKPPPFTCSCFFQRDCHVFSGSQSAPRTIERNKAGAQRMRRTKIPSARARKGPSGDDDKERRQPKCPLRNVTVPRNGPLAAPRRALPPPSPPQTGPMEMSLGRNQQTADRRRPRSLPASRRVDCFTSSRIIKPIPRGRAST